MNALQQLETKKNDVVFLPFDSSESESFLLFEPPFKPVL